MQTLCRYFLLIRHTEQILVGKKSLLKTIYMDTYKYEFKVKYTYFK